MNQAIIDIGSNSMHLTVYDVQNETFKILFRHKIMAGLASYIQANTISQDGIECACNGLLLFKETLDALKINHVFVFATASLRNVKNTQKAVKKIKKVCHVDVEVLSAETEALYSYYGAMRELDIHDGCFIDVGGASTEVVLFEKDRPKQSVSYKIGSLNLYKNCVKKILPGKRSILRMEDAIEHEIDKDQTFHFEEKEQMVCVGGTARTILKIACKYFNLPKDCRTITVKQLDELYVALIKRDRESLNLILRQSPERIHTIIPGLLILQYTLHKFKAKKMIVSNYGVREGYLCKNVLTKIETDSNTHKTEN